MSKGLKVSLVTVAIALMGMSAMATAPVISDIPDPIVGGGETVTPSNTFVYPDAINLNFYVQDDGGIENVVWSYEVAGTQIYSINGNDPIDSGSEDPTDPAAVSKDLGTVRNGEEDPDTAANTITIRNVNLSPIGGPNVDPGDTAGILSSETQVVTLYASDGSTYSQTEIMVYTDNEGEDRLSTGVVDGEQEYQQDFTNDDGGYISTTLNSATVTVGGNGICIEVAAGNTNIGQWISPYPLFEMQGNAVYRIRANVNGSQTTAGLVPLWDVIVQNFDSADGVGGANAYLADYLFLDNEGGANAVGPSVGLSNIELYFVPLSAKSPAWNDASTGAWTTANDGMNDIQIIFRVLDADESGGYGGELDVGQVCIQGIDIDRFDLNTNVTEGDTVMDLAVNQTNYRAEDLLGSSTFDWTTGVTYGPTDGNYEVELTQVQPGDGDHLGVGGSGAAEDDYPIVWDAETIYMIEMEVSAPTAGDEAQPNDVIQVGMGPPSWECFMLNSVTRGDSTMHNIGMPKSGTPQTYVTFFNSHAQSLSAQDDFRRLAPRVQILNSDALSFNGQSQNTGDTTIHSITVKKVTIP
jgi:hypothetical protein